MRLCWSAILKNESQIIERCLDSLLPHIDAAVVLDTGSTDQTPELVQGLFAKANKPVEIHRSEFKDFAQSRNEALAHARKSPIDYDYLLLSDADMELRVTDPGWVKQVNGGPAYDIEQKGGSISYWNRRLLHRSSDAVYQCPTHEYLDVSARGPVTGVWFVDHADGANRPEKFVRDIALLEAALKTETRPGLIQRIHFYLAQSYYDLGDWQQAAAHYQIRVTLGGFDEERWYAQRQLAHCYGKLGADSSFVWALLQAYQMRPSRAETLYDLARFFRERGDNHASLLFSEAGMALPLPKDQLFVNDYIYKDGLREEFAICAYYDERKRQRGAKEANKLALAGSEQARANLFWYLQPLAERVKSFKHQQIPFTPERGWVPLNPSVINHNGSAKLLVRTVNYTITPEGQYQMPADAIETRNFIGSLAGDFVEIKPPANFPDPQYSLVRGFEDSRLFEFDGELQTLSTVRELTPSGWCEQVLATLRWSDPCWCYENNWQQILSGRHVHEKNWMPWVKDGELRFVYRLGTLINLAGEVVARSEPKWNLEHVSGGSQVVKVDSTTFLAVVHEARTIPGRPNRYYQHRFVIFDNHDRVAMISPPFYFHDRQIEFCAGLAYFEDSQQLMLSYGIADREAWVATMDVDDVLHFTYQTNTL